mmetsp:Transcript_27350/g.40378  ORF Transcript_27350/g.40378 Transcript_27350/m.40378 type:complete len:757 (+) Transcript_27350:27-2297(+)
MKLTAESFIFFVALPQCYSLLSNFISQRRSSLERFSSPIDQSPELPEVPRDISPIEVRNIGEVYFFHWENALLEEYRENVEELKFRRKKWSRSRLEQSGMSIFAASAEPETEVFGEKIVRVYKSGETRLRERFNRGDVLVLTPEVSIGGKDPIPREGLVIDVGTDWITLGVGSSWPVGLWERRRNAGAYLVRLDRTAPQAPLKAQRNALQRLRNGDAGEAAFLFAHLFSNTTNASLITSKTPQHFHEVGIEEKIKNAMENAILATSFRPNESQKEAIVWALQKKLSLIRGPPGTGKSRTAALLISTALKMSIKSITNGESSDENDICKVNPRILAVAHSNGAADVLLEALLQMNVPAVRFGRPASVSPNVQHRTIVAISEKMPEVMKLRQQAADTSLDSQTRHAAAFDVKRYVKDIQQVIARTAPVIVTSCIGAHQLLDSYEEETSFSIVVLDEAAQTTEPALVCALSAAKARQIVLVGDSKQLPPTVTSDNPELRNTIGISPMARLEKIRVEQFTLKEQYRMPRALLEHPSKYFYDGMLKCAEQTREAEQTPPSGFPWPCKTEPLAFIQTGKDSEITHNFGGRSNPTEVKVIIGIISQIIQAGEISPENIAIITPYSKQVQQFRAELSPNNNIHGRKTENVKVGTVDSFQGQETDLVIFSAVRSNLVQELGFLRDSRRLNVAITRAKRGLIIVGDQKVLRTCRHWAALLDSCVRRGCAMDEQDFSDGKYLVSADPVIVDETTLELDMSDPYYGLF